MSLAMTNSCWIKAVFAGFVLSWSAGTPLFAGEFVRNSAPTRGGGTIAWQKGDTVYVTGTRGGDRIVIHRSGDQTVAGEVEVWDVGVSPSVVLGAYSGVANLDVDLLGGDNFLGLYRFDLSGDVTVTCADGNDQVYWGGVGGAPGGRTEIDGTFLVESGDGNDEVRVEQCLIGEVMIDAGNGDNVVLFGQHLQTGLAAYHGTLTGPVSVMTGAGNDLIAIIGSELGSQTAIDTAAGDDWVLFGLGIEDGALTIRGNELGDVAVNCGQGADLAGFFDNDAFGDIVVAMAQHQDAVWLGGLGAPNDFHQEVVVDGGPGSDEAYDDPANAYAVPPELTNIETVTP